MNTTCNRDRDQRGIKDMFIRMDLQSSQCRGNFDQSLKYEDDETFPSLGSSRSQSLPDQRGIRCRTSNLMTRMFYSSPCQTSSKRSHLTNRNLCSVNGFEDRKESSSIMENTLLNSGSSWIL
jgi:hypothetical protein